MMHVLEKLAQQMQQIGVYTELAGLDQYQIFLRTWKNTCKLDKYGKVSQ